MDRDLSRLDRYESRTSMPMTVLALTFLVVYSAPIIWTTPPEVVLFVLGLLNLSLWLAFLADLGVRAWLSGNPIGYILQHPIELLLIILPMLRPLRVLRVFPAMATLFRRGSRVSISKTLAGAGGVALLLMFIAAVAILDAERGQAGATIQSFGDAIWWSGTTITTVGYGDMYPVTEVGRLIAFVLMLVGISILGVVTASIAAWFVGRGDADDGNPELLAEIRALRADVDRLGFYPSAAGSWTDTPPLTGAGRSS